MFARAIWRSFLFSADSLMSCMFRDSNSDDSQRDGYWCGTGQRWGQQQGRSLSALFPHKARLPEALCSLLSPQGGGGQGGLASCTSTPTGLHRLHSHSVLLCLYPTITFPRFSPFRSIGAKSVGVILNRMVDLM